MENAGNAKDVNCIEPSDYAVDYGASYAPYTTWDSYINAPSMLNKPGEYACVGMSNF